MLRFFCILLLAIFFSNSLYASFSCGPHLTTYKVISVTGAKGNGVRCVKFFGDVHRRELVWYGEGYWGNFKYRHLGKASYSGTTKKYHGKSADIYGNGEHGKGKANNLIIASTMNGFKVTGSGWNEYWTKVSNHSQYSSLNLPVKKCGKHFKQYRAYEREGRIKGRGTRCVLGHANNIFWYGEGVWNTGRYFHIGVTRWMVMNGQQGMFDICLKGAFCGAFDFGKVRVSETSIKGMTEKGYKSRGNGLINELWFPSKRSHSARLHFVRMANNDGTTHRITSTANQVKKWVKRANDVYYYGDIEFFFIPDELGPDWSNWDNTAVNRMLGECDGINFNTGGSYPSWCNVNDTWSYNPNNTWEEERDEANDFAADFPEKIVIFMRHGPFNGATGGGFSNSTYNFVAAPGYHNTSYCGVNENIDLLAHEMGHYLSLDHPFGVSFQTVTEAEDYFINNGRDILRFDGDGLTDTAPDPFIKDLECDITTWSVNLDGISIPIPRNNIMTYWKSPSKNLSGLQLRKVFKTLKSRLGFYY